jgi:predicted nucleotide-binding protein
MTEISVTAEMNAGTALVPEPGNEIFVVHGRNEAFRLKVVDFLSKATGRPPTVLIDEASKGKELFEKFEDAAGRACFAVVLATADDVGRRKTAKTDNDRARQNVILELGVDLLGRSARDRVDRVAVSIVECGVGVCLDDGFDCRRSGFSSAPRCGHGL